MPDTPIPAPEEGDFNDYYRGYVSLADKDDIYGELARQMDELRERFGTLSEEAGRYRYAEGKWSIKDLLLHVNDMERVFAYRLLRISRADATPLPGFDHDAFVEHAEADRRPMASILDEFKTIRQATLSLCRGMSEEQWNRTGTASGYELKACAVPYIISGHLTHHLNIIRERYGEALSGEK